MHKSEEHTKKCYCARCFMPIDPEDKVDIDGQNLHRTCSMCCICRTIPTSLKMFYGHVFCNECFKTHVLNRFRGEPQCMHSNSWWKPQDAQENCKEKCKAKAEPDSDKSETCEDSTAKPEERRRCICARCLQTVEEAVKVTIGGQSFHPHCARCYFCHTIPTDNVKIYYGQVFCEDCFNRYVMARNKESPAEHFRTCFEQWQNNSQFADNMRDFMSGKDSTAHIVFMMQGAHPPFCRCGASHDQEWPHNEQRKSVSPASPSEVESLTWDLSYEARDSDRPPSSRESANQEHLLAAAAEKIEKLTKYLQDNSPDTGKFSKKWKNFVEYAKSSIFSEADQMGWVDLQDPKVKNEVCCPKCLWQCGPIFVNSEYFEKEVVSCGDNFCFE